MHKNERDILNWLHKDDIIIVDRGFRDSIPTIKHFGYEAVMPNFLNRKKQFSTREANHNRLITKVRWVIESGIVWICQQSFYFFLFLVNCRIKQWKYFSQIIQNSSLPFISEYLEIVCALINAFCQTPVSDIHEGRESALQMLKVFNEANHVQTRLKRILNERLEWKKYDARMCLFPELDEADLRNLCFGRKALVLIKKS